MELQQPSVFWAIFPKDFGTCCRDLIPFSPERISEVSHWRWLSISASVRLRGVVQAKLFLVKLGKTFHLGPGFVHHHTCKLCPMFDAQTLRKTSIQTVKSNLALENVLSESIWLQRAFHQTLSTKSLITLVCEHWFMPADCDCIPADESVL